MMPWLLLLAGLAVIVFGGELFVKSAVGLAHRWGVPQLVIGATLMSVASTTPEIAVAFMAGKDDEPELALGNAIGSPLCNMGLIAGTAAMMRTIAPPRAASRKPLLALVAAAVIVLLAALDGTISTEEAAVLACYGAAYFLWDFIFNYQRSRRKKAREEKNSEDAEHHQSIYWLMGLFIVGAGAVVGGSRLLVDNAIAVAESLGVPSIIIGITAVTVGTSLPEFVTAIKAARRNIPDLSIGNLIGASFANLTLVAGTAGLMSTIDIPRQQALLNLPALFAVLGFAGFMLLWHQHIAWRSGLTLLAMYALYLGINLAVLS